MLATTSFFHSVPYSPICGQVPVLFSRSQYATISAGISLLSYVSASAQKTSMGKGCWRQRPFSFSIYTLPATPKRVERNPVSDYIIKGRTIGDPFIHTLTTSANTPATCSAPSCFLSSLCSGYSQSLAPSGDIQFYAVSNTSCHALFYYSSQSG